MESQDLHTVLHDVIFLVRLQGKFNYDSCFLRIF